MCSMMLLMKELEGRKMTCCRITYVAVGVYPYNNRYIPHFVCGDMDSARKDVLEFFESKVLYFAGGNKKICTCDFFVIGLFST